MSDEKTKHEYEDEISQLENKNIELLSEIREAKRRSKKIQKGILIAIVVWVALTGFTSFYSNPAQRSATDTLKKWADEVTFGIFDIYDYQAEQDYNKYLEEHDLSAPERDYYDYE